MCSASLYMDMVGCTHHSSTTTATPYTTPPPALVLPPTQELRGNIRVYVRVKPLSQDERQAGIQTVLRCMDDSRVVCNANTGASKMFDFDRTFGPESSQEVVFEDVAQLVTSALDGYNVCIFAYGQTGTCVCG